jgi:hypothetical protein
MRTHRSATNQQDATEQYDEEPDDTLMAMGVQARASHHQPM